VSNRRVCVEYRDSPQTAKLSAREANGVGNRWVVELAVKWRFTFVPPFRSKRGTPSPTREEWRPRKDFFTTSQVLAPKKEAPT